MATIRTTYKYKCDLDKGTLETTLRNSLMQADALADAFAVTVQRNGADVDISGMTVYGYLYANATKTTVPLRGTVSGSTATVILSEDCYAVPGYASLMIQLHDGDVRHTVLKVDFVVTRTGGTLVLDGDNILPTLAELLGQISAMEQATAEAREATQVANQAVENVEAFKGEIQGDLAALAEDTGKRYTLFYGSAATIPDGTDLNTLTAPGNYRVTSVSSANTMQNMPPIVQSGRLTVDTLYSKDRIVQRYTVALSGERRPIHYERSTANGGTTWGEWYQMITSLDFDFIAEEGEAWEV